MAGATVAVIDRGGRAAALADKYLKSPHVGGVLVIPGNDMIKIGQEKPAETFPMLEPTDVRNIVQLCKSRRVALVDVEQDNAIMSGLTDSLRMEGITTLGPSRRAGEIEWSKVFAREFGRQHHLPQPWFQIFKSPDQAIQFVNRIRAFPRFVKADGLAEGKGAIGVMGREEAISAILEISRLPNGAGKRMLIEEWMMSDGLQPGEEFSAFAITDGMHIEMLGYAQDHKREFDGDRGRNTGGMGVSTPPLAVDGNVREAVEAIFETTITGLAEMHRPYNGVLYLGGMLLTKSGMVVPHIVEWNARWGDPECQALVRGIKNDLFELNFSAARGEMNGSGIETDGKARVVVAGASKGYPGNYSHVAGKEIFGFERAAALEGVTIVGAGVAVEEGRYYANGGRLFYIVAEGGNVIAAQHRAYSAMGFISIEGDNLHYRKDIGHWDIERLIRQ